MVCNANSSEQEILTAHSSLVTNSWEASVEIYCSGRKEKMVSFPLRKRRRKKLMPCPPWFWWRQFSTSKRWRILILLLCTALFTIRTSINLLRPAKFERLSRTHSTVSEECQSSHVAHPGAPDSGRIGLYSAASSSSASFRILCTATRRKINWGSYELRCRDLEIWAKRCTQDVFIQTGISFQDLERLRWFRSMLGELAEEEKITYNASIFVKSYPNTSLPLYGKMFMDVVDEYWVPDEQIPPFVDLILQTPWQGNNLFKSHNYKVVEHWYNSYPADMALTGDPDFVPPISEHLPIKIATIWNTRRSRDPSEGGCPEVQTANVTYQCIDKEFDISKWYLKLMKQKNDKCDMEHTLANSELGPGKLYFNIFRKYDALVVLAKNHTMKLNYGNVQRTVSQMRSGVPVLVEIRGKVLQDFLEKYNYTCAFQRYSERSTGGRKLWSFNEAMERLKDSHVRRECQRQGLKIVKDYSPSRIGQKFLRTLGYNGEFLC